MNARKLNWTIGPFKTCVKFSVKRCQPRTCVNVMKNNIILCIGCTTSAYVGCELCETASESFFLHCGHLETLIRQGRAFTRGSPACKEVVVPPPFGVGIRLAKSNGSSAIAKHSHPADYLRLLSFFNLKVIGFSMVSAWFPPSQKPRLLFLLPSRISFRLCPHSSSTTRDL